MIEQVDCLNTRTVPLHWCHCLINGSILEWQFLDSIYSFAYPQGIKSVHFKKSVTRSSFLAKSVVIFADFVLIPAKMTTLFARNDDRVTDFLK